MREELAYGQGASLMSMPSLTSIFNPQERLAESEAQSKEQIAQNQLLQASVANLQSDLTLLRAKELQLQADLDRSKEQVRGNQR